jgi:hypothetical protein
MADIETIIRQRALQRLASVFKVEPESLSPTARFGWELKAQPVSDFRANEFDIIDEDIRDVADKLLLKSMERGELEIRTVADYCDHMVRCYHDNPADVAYILLSESHENKKISAASIALLLVGIVCLGFGVYFGGVAIFKTIFS